MISARPESDSKPSGSRLATNAEAWFDFLTERPGLSKKPAFIGMSRGGEYAFTWATANPDKVSCIYADNPGGNRELMMRLSDLARNDVPLLLVCGSLDPWLATQTRIGEQRYRELGGQMSVIVKEGEGHYPLAPQDAKPVVDFIVNSIN
jgi:pimeloyl-ACP methyl ester carboxylesterase